MVQTIRAAFAKPSGGVELREVERPNPEDGSIMVKLEASGVCGTDLEKLVGKNISSSTLGHEVSGVVTESHSDRYLSGDRVIPHHHVACGKCGLCQIGANTMCEVYKASNLVPGGFADEFLVPAHNVSNGGVHMMPDRIQFEDASFAEPLGCCIRGLTKALGGERGGDRNSIRNVLLVGAGPIGLLHMELLKSYLEEPEIYAADISKVRLDFAGKFEDAKPLVVPRSGEGFSKMALRERPEGFDLVIVATGIPEAFGDGLRCVRKSGKLLLFGVPLKDSFHALDLPGFFQNELTLTTSYATTDVEMAQALELLSSRKINVSKFITAKFPLEKITQGMNEARSETQVKVLITR